MSDLSKAKRKFFGTIVAYWGRKWVATIWSTSLIGVFDGIWATALLAKGADLAAGIVIAAATLSIAWIIGKAIEGTAIEDAAEKSKAS